MAFKEPQKPGLHLPLDRSPYNPLPDSLHSCCSQILPPFIFSGRACIQMIVTDPKNENYQQIVCKNVLNIS